MSINGRGRKKLLDGKDCFVQWATRGSLRKVYEHYASNGIKNPSTGKPFTENGIYDAALCWVCENPEESREYYLDAGSEIAKHDLLWEEFLVETYMQRCPRQRRKFVDWARAHGFYRKYFHKFSDFYGIVDPDEFDKTLEA
jgi:hypothetical protein